MTKQELYRLTGTLPVFMKDGSYGMLIRWPSEEDESDDLCGIQVAGEDEIRWVSVSKLKDSGNGAIKEIE